MSPTTLWKCQTVDIVGWQENFLKTGIIYTQYARMHVHYILFIEYYGFGVWHAICIKSKSGTKFKHIFFIYLKIIELIEQCSSNIILELILNRWNFRLCAIIYNNKR